ncbi:hypothetical protein GLOIN_2v1475678 [Rhizophagus clarus]|uniref:Uncharacterized protein n=1 Tax=Rhizophagus clarus TaxID=94130 RepID=A0A8H3QSZ1_9GLOM|nr:hypothetical protein GLOIN_2v1475678 [Rhizophagus clarus]
MSRLAGRCQNVTLQYPQNGNFQNPQVEPSIWLNISAITPTIFNENDTSLYTSMLDMFEFSAQDYNKSDNLLYLSFESFQFRRFWNGQAYFITLYPTVVVDDFSFHNYGNSCINNHYTPYHKLELNPQLIQLPVKLNPNEINLGIRPRSHFYSYEEKKPGYNYTDLLADLGGFYNAVLGTFILLFGTQKLEPWKSLMKNIAKRYVSSAGIPLVEKVNERPVNFSLEERVQILETLLKDYYLDDYYLEKIRKVKIKHRRLLEKYNNMELAEQKNNDENSEHES